MESTLIYDENQRQQPTPLTYVRRRNTSQNLNNADNGLKGSIHDDYIGFIPEMQCWFEISKLMINDTI